MDAWGAIEARAGLIARHAMQLTFWIFRFPPKQKAKSGTSICETKRSLKKQEGERKKRGPRRISNPVVQHMGCSRSCGMSEQALRLPKLT